MWKKYSENYEASIDGHIRNSRTGRVLHEYIGKDGYLRTQFDGKTRLVHSKLTEDDVAYIKKNYIKGDKTYGGIALVNHFNVAHQTICAIISGQNWKEEPK